MNSELSLEILDEVLGGHFWDSLVIGPVVVPKFLDDHTPSNVLNAVMVIIGHKPPA